MVGVPTRADVGFLRGFLAYFGDQRITVTGFEKAVDVDLPPALGKGNVLFGADLLVAQEDDTIIDKGLA